MAKSKKQAGEQEAAPAAPPPTPRLWEHYRNVVRPKLMKEFDLKNPHEVPTLLKIVLNVGMGDAPKNPKMLESAVTELGVIAGQKAVVTRARKAISNFSLRAGMPIGTSVPMTICRITCELYSLV